jgi:hypothetical protein
MGNSIEFEGKAALMCHENLWKEIEIENKV